MSVSGTLGSCTLMSCMCYAMLCIDSRRIVKHFGVIYSFCMRSPR